jgi:DNA-binding transcriptional ArsR family regulator
MDPLAPAFRALSDPSRRLLLDRLFERDGQTLGELCGYLPEMTRFGVMRHLGVLEEAGLLSTTTAGSANTPNPSWARSAPSSSTWSDR